MTTIKFTASGCFAPIGNFAPGDILRCSEEVARHLVEAARCAAYVQPPAAPVAPPEPAAVVEPAAAPAPKRTKKPTGSKP